MCGKFTQMASWSEVTQFSRSLARPPGSEGEPGANDDSVVSTPMRFANIIRLDDAGRREVVAMRWGFAERGAATPARPKHMHARSETIDRLPTFREHFKHRRGILLTRTFNEGEEVGKRTVQWTITPRDGLPIPIAVIWEEWRNGDMSLLTYVQVTTPANALISRITDRMPAILPPETWPIWLGETPAAAEEIKALLKTYDDDGNWDMAPEPKAPRR